MVAKILLVDDEPNLVQAVSYNLRKEGHQVVSTGDGVKALEMAMEVRPDLVLLDIMLPGLDGIEICRRIRAQSTVPIIMLSAKDEEIDHIVGLEVGADDYLSKPFSMRELLARVKAMLRRTQMLQEQGSSFFSDSLKVGGLEIDQRRREVTCHGKAVALKPKEFELLVYLAAHPGQVFSRDQLLTRVWSYEYAGDTRTVDVHVKTLREKLGDSAHASVWIETVRGVGYRMRREGL